MSFESDLKGIIRHEFKRCGIECNAENMNVCLLATRYCEMWKQHIAPARRTIHLPNEIHDSLEQLTQAPPELRYRTLEARDAVFELRRLLSHGKDVTQFLGRHTKDAPVPKRSHLVGHSRSDGQTLWGACSHPVPVAGQTADRMT